MGQDEEGGSGDAGADGPRKGDGAGPLFWEMAVGLVLERAAGLHCEGWIVAGALHPGCSFVSWAALKNTNVKVLFLTKST